MFRFALELKKKIDCPSTGNWGCYIHSLYGLTEVHKSMPIKEIATWIYFRYFTSVPAPTKPLSLPRPPKKGDIIPADSNPTHDGPVVLSPQRKVRRVMLNQEGSEGTAQHESGEHQTRGTRLTGDPGAQSSRAPMSIDVGAIFGAKPFSRTPLKR